MSTEAPRYSDVIIDQLTASKVNGFPFWAYTGLKLLRQTDRKIQLIAKRNPGRVHIVSIQYHYDSDTYILIFARKNGVATTHIDVYADVMVNMIIDAMGVR